MYSDIEFSLDSDYAIKRGLDLSFDCFMDNQRQNSYEKRMGEENQILHLMTLRVDRVHSLTVTRVIFAFSFDFPLGLLR